RVSRRPSAGRGPASEPSLELLAVLFEPADSVSRAPTPLLVAVVQVRTAQRHEAFEEISSLVQPVALAEEPQALAPPVEREAPALGVGIGTQRSPPARRHRDVVRAL